MPCFEAHHEIVTGNLVLCDGSRFGAKVNGPKKPETCGSCQAWIGRCLKGHKGKVASDPACNFPSEAQS